MTRVLIVEDEEHLAAGLRFNLDAEGYDVRVEENGRAALDLLRGTDHFDLVLLDIMLPEMDGFEVVRRLRDAGDFVPVMILTARGQTDDVLRGFEVGADDYLPKPFDLPVLLARIEGLLRRRDRLRHGSEDGSSDEPDDDYRFVGGRIDFSRQLVERNGKKQVLTVMETALLRHLVRHEGSTVPRTALLEEVWGVRQDTDTRTIDNFIARLRRRLEDEPSKPRYLQTVRGVGYRFVADPGQDESSRLGARGGR